MSSLPILIDETCEPITELNFIYCTARYQHKETNTIADFEFSLKNGELQRVDAHSAKKISMMKHGKPIEQYCARNTLILFDEHGDDFYEFWGMQREQWCHPAEFGTLMWSMVDLLRRHGISKPIEAGITEGGRIFAERTNSRISESGQRVLEYNLDGIQEYAIQRINEPATYHERSIQ